MREGSYWQSFAASAAERRARESFSVWVAGPVDTSWECVHELKVSRPTQLAHARGATSRRERALRAIIDTGCNATAIRADLAAELGLPPIGMIAVHTGSSGKEQGVACQVVLAELRLVDPAGQELVIQHDLTTLDMSDEVLLGMDLLRGGVLDVDLVDGVWQWKAYRSSSGRTPPAH